MLWGQARMLGPDILGLGGAGRFPFFLLKQRLPYPGRQPFGGRSGHTVGMWTRTIMAVDQGNDEKQLIRAAAGGDERALRVLYEAHAGRAYALALRLTRSESDAFFSIAIAR